MKTPRRNAAGSADPQDQKKEAIKSALSESSKGAAEASAKTFKDPSSEADRSVAEALMDCYNG